jgi:hypothetical protein
MIVLFIVSDRARISTVFSTTVTPFPRMCVDHIFGWSVETLLLAECRSAAGIIVKCGGRMDDPGARGVLHILPWTVKAIVKMIPWHIVSRLSIVMLSTLCG